MVKLGKRALLWLFCILLLLTGCGAAPQDSIGDSMESSQMGSEQEESDESVSASVTNNYLADQRFDTEEPLAAYDVQSQYAYTGVDLCESEVAYNGRDTLASFYMYRDKQSGVSGKLCGKPECAHEDKTCNAYVSFMDIGLTVYDGSLYWSGLDLNSQKHERYLWKMNLDGTQREKVQKLAEVQINTNPLVQIHRGYVYTAGIYSTVEQGEARNGILITAEQIGKQAEPIVIMDRAYSNVFLSYSMRFIGNMMYIQVEAESSLEGEDLHHILLYRWDSKTRQLECLLDIEEENFVIGDMQIDETGTIYLTGRRGTMLGVYRYNFQTKNIETVSQWECTQNGFNRMTRDNVITIYYDENDDIYMQVRTFSGEMVCEREITWEGKAEENRCFLIFCGGDEEYVFYCASQGNNRWFLQVPLDAERAAEVVWEYVL